MSKEKEAAVPVIRASLGGVLYCPECKCALAARFANGRKIVYHHELGPGECPHSGKRFEAPTVKLQEVK